MAGDTIPRRDFLVGVGFAGTAAAAGVAASSQATAQTPAPNQAFRYPGRRCWRQSRARTSARAQRDRARVHRRRRRHHDPGRRAVALRQRLRGRHLHRSPARQRLGRRRQDVSHRPVPARQAGAGLSARADAARVLRRRHRCRQRVVAQDLRQGFRPARRADAHRRAQGDARRARPSSAHLSARRSSTRCCTLTMEGFFADPIYGGNRNMASWKMLGFPGLPATYAKVIEEYRDKRYVGAPQSIADFS